MAGIYEGRKLTNNLLLLDLNPSACTDEMQDWRTKEGLLYISGCRRKVIVGHDDALRSAPAFDASLVRTFNGAAAYTRLLEYITGLLSRTPGENQIVGQFKQAFHDLERANGQSACKLRRLFQHVLEDNGRIRNFVTKPLKPAFFEACAHELSEQEGHHVALVVANTTAKGNEPDVPTRSVIRYLTAHKKGAASTVIITHPDEASRKALFSNCLQERARGHISSKLKTLPFNEVFDAGGELQGVHRVYVCYPMGANDEADRLMIGEWRQKEALGGKLIHLGGPRKSQRVSVGAWVDTDMELYVPPERITEWQESRKDCNAYIVQEGKKACKAYAERRLEAPARGSHSAPIRLNMSLINFCAAAPILAV